jgi:NAD+ diphosphatase
MTFRPAVRPESPATPLAWHFVFVEGKLLLPEAEGSVLAPHAGLEFERMEATRHYLGRLEAMDCWAVSLAEAPAGWRPVSMRAAMMQLPDPLPALVGRAAQVLEWDRAHRYCGVCGTPTVPHEHDRARHCPSCGHVAYPRISPAMMALVWRGREVLLARSPQYTPGMYSALAGFVEPGESIEDCVRREVAEEVSVEVTRLRYYGSQSWPFPHSLMVAFTAEWVAGEIVPQAGEIEHAAWFPIDALPGIPPRFSIAGHLIRDTVQALGEGRLPPTATAELS